MHCQETNNTTKQMKTERDLKMKVEMILNIANENKDCYIIQNNNIVSFYDGRNSIDTIYNDCEITKIKIDKNGNLFLTIA